MIFPRLRSLTSTPGGTMRCGKACDSSQVVFKWQTGTDLQCVFMFFILNSYGRCKGLRIYIYILYIRTWLWQWLEGMRQTHAYMNVELPWLPCWFTRRYLKSDLFWRLVEDGGGGKDIFSFRELLTQWRPGLASCTVCFGWSLPLRFGDISISGTCTSTWDAFTTFSGPTQMLHNVPRCAKSPHVAFIMTIHVLRKSPWPLRKAPDVKSNGSSGVQRPSRGEKCENT